MVIIMYYYSNLFFLYAILGHLLEKNIIPRTRKRHSLRFLDSHLWNWCSNHSF